MVYFLQCNEELNRKSNRMNLTLCLSCKACRMKLSNHLTCNNCSLSQHQALLKPGAKVMLRRRQPQVPRILLSTGSDGEEQPDADTQGGSTILQLKPAP